MTSSPRDRLFALIPAAGQSTRMREAKLLLRFKGKTLMEWVIQAFRRAGIERVLVVIGSHVPELVPIVEAHQAVALLLKQPSSEMRATIEQGLAWAEQQWTPRPEDGWFLCPGDHPAISSTVIARLAHEWVDSNRRSSILIPTYQGERGHPTLIGWEHVAGIRGLSREFGLNRYLRDHAELTRELAVNEPGVLTDLDTPADFDRFVEEDSQRG